MKVDSSINVIAKARAASLLPSQLFTAHILSPEEVFGRIKREGDVAEQVRGRWVLQGDMQRAFFQALKRKGSWNPAAHVMAYSTPEGANYAVITHQLYGFGHRFVLPLYEPQVADFLQAVLTQDVGFALGCAGEEEVVMIFDGVQGFEFMPALALVQKLEPPALLRALREIPRVARALQQQDPVGTDVPTGEEPMRDVSLSMVVPLECFRQCGVIKEGR